MTAAFAFALGGACNVWVQSMGLQHWMRARLCFGRRRELQCQVATNGIVFPEVHEGVAQQHIEAIISVAPHPDGEGAQQGLIGREIYFKGGVGYD